MMLSIISLPGKRQSLNGLTRRYYYESVAICISDGKVEVINSCATEKGDRKVGLGRAKVLDSDSNAKLKVTFVKFVDWIFAFG